MAAHEIEWAEPGEVGRTPEQAIGPLRRAHEAACKAEGCSLEALTVLSAQNDPYRVDTLAGHIAGAWFAEVIGDRRLHLRGCHYVALGRIKPNGVPYTSEDSDWSW